MRYIKGMALALAVLAFPSVAGAACQLSLVGPVTQQPLNYNPFQAGASTAQVSFTIQNADAKPCDAAFTFFTAGALQASATGGKIAYQLLGSSGPVVQAAPSPPATLPAAAGGAAYITVGARQTYTANVLLSVGDGQVVPPGTYTNTIYLGIYQGSGGQYTKAAILPATLGIAINVNSQMTVTLAGGGHKTTLSFGDFVEGATRSVQLLAYANQGFRLLVNSDNFGVMKPLDPAALAEGIWRVPYTVAVNRTAPFSLSQPRLIALWPAATLRTGITIPIEVQVGSVAGQRAGIYRDVITITIDANP